MLLSSCLEQTGAAEARYLSLLFQVVETPDNITVTVWEAENPETPENAASLQTVNEVETIIYEWFPEMPGLDFKPVPPVGGGNYYD